MTKQTALNGIWPEWKAEDTPLGRGSYGAVYKAVRNDHGIESASAIKVISFPRDETELDSLYFEGLTKKDTKKYYDKIVKDFVGEIRMMESFKGTQNIVSIEDYKVVEKKDGIGWDVYIRMELLRSFSSYEAEKKLSEKEAVKLGLDICSALELLASRNIVHRDIKPQNIFVNEFGNFKLGDFGIARDLGSSLSARGTPNYMAPEVIKNKGYDTRADIYSLGMVLYTVMNGGRLPFLDPEKQLLLPSEIESAAKKRLSGAKLPPPAYASHEFAELILTACSFDPETRFLSAAAFKNALLSLYPDPQTEYYSGPVPKAAAAEKPPETKRDRKTGKERPAKKKKPLWAKLLIALAILLGVGVLSVGVFFVGAALGFMGTIDLFPKNDDPALVGDKTAFIESICGKYTIRSLSGSTDGDFKFESVPTGLMCGTFSFGDKNKVVLFKITDVYKESETVYSFKIVNPKYDSYNQTAIEKAGFRKDGIMYVYTNGTPFHSLPADLADALYRNPEFSGSHVLVHWVIWSEGAEYYIWGDPTDQDPS